MTDHTTTRYCGMCRTTMTFHPRSTRYGYCTVDGPDITYHQHDVPIAVVSEWHCPSCKMAVMTPDSSKEFEHQLARFLKEVI